MPSFFLSRSIQIIVVTTILSSPNIAKILRYKGHSLKPLENVYGDKTIENNSIPISLLTSLCKKFPHVPCRVITGDKTLQRLIEKSLQKISDSQHQTKSQHQIKHRQIETKKQTLNSMNLEERKNIPEEIEKFPKENKNKHDQTISKKYKRITLHKFYPKNIKYKGKSIKQSGNEIYPEDQYAIKHLDLDEKKTHQRFLFKLQPKELPYWKIHQNH